MGAIKDENLGTRSMTLRGRDLFYRLRRRGTECVAFPVMTDHPLLVEQIHAGSEALHEIEQWYSSPDVRQWMYGFRFSDFVKNIGTSVENPNDFRLATLAWAGFDTAGDPVAFVGGNVTVAKPNKTTMVNGAFVTTPDAPGPRTFGFIYAVADSHRQRGFGAGTLDAVLRSPSLHDVEVFSCHIDAGNEASLKLIRKFDQFAESKVSENKRHFRHERTPAH